MTKDLPETIPVARYKGGSYYIGSYGYGNQFWGRVVAVHKSGKAEDFRTGDPKSKKYWYAILHKFDSRGHHLDTDHKIIGTMVKGEPSVLKEAELTTMEFIQRLGNVEYGEIAIRLFQVSIEGKSFGMLDTSSDEFGVTVTMKPGDLVFYPPWNGDYDT